MAKHDTGTQALSASEPGMTILFPSERAAAFPLAGIPAAARAVALAIAEQEPGEWAIAIAVPGGWQPPPRCRTEWQRLAPDQAVLASDSHAFSDSAGGSLVDGLELLEHRRLAVPGAARESTCGHVDAAIARLRRLHRAIIKGTAKPTDGIVSRHLNRPVSQAISSMLLRFFPACLPAHATIGVAICALVMMVALIWGGSNGAIVGAILFQAASILDGVDGEIARATFRTSPAGATLDSVTDAFTNLGFIMGLGWNLHERGETAPAVAAATGLILLAIGLLILGAWAWRRDRRVHFDALKPYFTSSPARTGNVLAKIFMRDFYALALAIAVVAGLAGWAMFLFAVAVGGWLLAILAVLAVLVFTRAR